MKKGLFLLGCWLGLLFSAFGQNPDIDLLRQANLNRNPALDGTFRAVTNSVGPAAFGGPVLLLGLSFLRHDSTGRRNRYAGAALYTGVSVVGSAGLTTLLKYAIQRPRPVLTYPDIQPLVEESSASFPSGHTTNAFAFATALSLSYPRWYVVMPAYAWAGAVGYSRLHLGVHYPSDILAGAVVGAGTAWLTHKLNRRLATHGLFRHRLAHHPLLPVHFTLCYFP